MIRQVMKEKMDARLMGWFDSGLGLYLFTVDEPKRTASGGIDLTGLKMRTSPAYRDFVKDLGGTAVVMRGGAIYTALERGTIQGMGTGLQVLVDQKLDKFTKYRIEPPMTHTGIFMIMNHKVYDGLPQKTRDLLDKLSLDWEVQSREDQKRITAERKAKLAATGTKTVTLPDAAATQFVALFRKGAWQRMERNPKIKIDLKKLKKALNYN
jgi:TRAP-type C4-dicarboxylate transport system substrate-binding protein